MKIKTMALTGAAFFALGASAAASGSGWFVGVGNGVSVPSSISAKWQAGSTTTRKADLSLSPTWRGIASFGYITDFHLRLEGEFGYTHPRFNKSAATAMGVERADFRLLSGMANVYYDAPISRDWSVTFGVGAGYGRTRLASTGNFNHSSDGLTGQIIAGAIYRLSDAVDLQLDYRYVATRSLDYKGAGGTGIDEKFDWAGSHNLMFTLRLFFDREPLSRAVRAPMPAPLPRQVYTPPPQQPRYVPPPAPSPLPSYVAPERQVAPPQAAPATTYVLFFDFDSADMDEQAQAVIAKAVKTAMTTGYVKILITGHTDTVGTERYNMQLSVDRAKTVKDEMVRRGISGETIAILGAGYFDPVVQTGPGVREPQNRRAIIQLSP